MKTYLYTTTHIYIYYFFSRGIGMKIQLILLCLLPVFRTTFDYFSADATAAIVNILLYISYLDLFILQILYSKESHK